MPNTSPPLRGRLVSLAMDENNCISAHFDTGSVVSPFGFVHGMDAKMVSTLLRNLALDIERNFTDSLTPEGADRLARRIAAMADIAAEDAHARMAPLGEFSVSTAKPPTGTKH